MVPENVNDRRWNRYREHISVSLTPWYWRREKNLPWIPLGHTSHFEATPVISSDASQVFNPINSSWSEEKLYILICWRELYFFKNYILYHFFFQIVYRILSKWNMTNMNILMNVLQNILFRCVCVYQPWWLMTWNVRSEVVITCKLLPKIAVLMKSLTVWWSCFITDGGVIKMTSSPGKTCFMFSS